MPLKCPGETMMNTCPQCSAPMIMKTFDIGYGKTVESLQCEKCGFIKTNEIVLKKAIHDLKQRMCREVKIVKIGKNLGIKLPDDTVKGYSLKKGKDVILKPEIDGVKLVIEG